MNNQNPNNNRNYNSQNNNNPNYNNEQYNNQPNQYNNEYNNPGYNGQYNNNPGYNGQQYDNQNTQYNNTINDQQYYNQQNNQQYNIPPVNPNYNNYEEEPNNEKKKSPIPVIITAVVTFLVLVVGLYFGYNKFMKKENVVDVSAYEINFVTYGNNGEGKPEVDIKKIPEVANTSTEISNFLSKPDISYDKKENLKNGDKVEVTITLNHNTADRLKLEPKGEFKRTFTVNGLSEKEKEKEKETIIVKDNSSSSSNSSSSGSNRTYFSNRPARIYVDAGVNLRSSSNDSSSVLDTAKKGDTVYVDFTERNSKGEEWSYVTYKGKQGWMRTDLIGH